MLSRFYCILCGLYEKQYNRFLVYHRQSSSSSTCCCCCCLILDWIWSSSSRYRRLLLLPSPFSSSSNQTNHRRFIWTALHSIRIQLSNLNQTENFLSFKQHKIFALNSQCFCECSFSLSRLEFKIVRENLRRRKKKPKNQTNKRMCVVYQGRTHWNVCIVRIHSIYYFVVVNQTRKQI